MLKLIALELKIGIWLEERDFVFCSYNLHSMIIIQSKFESNDLSQLTKIVLTTLVGIRENAVSVLRF